MTEPRPVVDISAYHVDARAFVEQLEREGYQAQQQHQTLAPGARVRHVLHGDDDAFILGSATVHTVMTRTPSRGGRDTEVVVIVDGAYGAGVRQWSLAECAPVDDPASSRSTP